MGKIRKQKSNQPHGHYCRVCGEHKANEKFSGKGHAAHICKKCSALPPEQRSELETLGKIHSMAGRYLSNSEIKWLRNRMKDTRPEVRDAAREVHNLRFPHYERNQMKKGLTAFSLELYLHDEICDEWGGTVPVHVRVFAEDTGLFRRIDYNAPQGEQEKEVTVSQQEARQFLKSVVHEHNAIFWEEDCSDAAGGFDPYLDLLPEYRPDREDEWEDADVETAEPPADPNREPVWSLCLELNDGSFRDMAFYNQTPDPPVLLFWELMEWFEPEDDWFDEE